MTATVIPVDPFLEREHWLELRRQGIGASDAAAVVGLSPYESPFSLYLEKTGHGLDPDEPSEPMEWGLLLEPIVRHYFTQRTGLAVVRPAGILVHRDHPWMIASLDGFVVDGNGEETGVYEGKTASAWKSREWDVDDGQVPEHVIVQVQHQLAVTDLPLAHVAVLVGGQHFHSAVIERDDRFIADLIAIEEKFWTEHVLTDVPPPMDGHNATTEAVKELWPTSTAALEVDLPAEARRLVADLLVARKAIKVAKENEAEAANQLKALLGEAEVGRVDGEKAVTCKSSDRAGYTVEPTTVRPLVVSKGFAP